MAMQVVLNQETNNIRRSACSHREGDFPASALGLEARSVEAISNFAVMLPPLGSGGDVMMVLCDTKAINPRFKIASQDANFRLIRSDETRDLETFHTMRVLESTPSIFNTFLVLGFT